MKHDNIFDSFTNNEEISDVALCAMYDFLQSLIREFEMSAFYRLKISLEELNEDKVRTNHDRSTDDNADPF